MSDFLQFALSLPFEIVFGMVLFAAIGAVVMYLVLGPDLMRVLIFPAFLVIAFMAYKIGGIGAAALALIAGLIAVVANPKPPGGYWGQQ